MLDNPYTEVFRCFEESGKTRYSDGPLWVVANLKLICGNQLLSRNRPIQTILETLTLISRVS